MLKRCESTDKSKMFSTKGLKMIFLLSKYPIIHSILNDIFHFFSNQFLKIYYIFLIRQYSLFKCMKFNYQSDGMIIGKKPFEIEKL